MSLKRYLIIFVALAFVFALVPLQSRAAGFVECGVGKITDPGYRACGLCDVFKLIKTIIDFFLFPTAQNNGFAIVPLIAAVLIVAGGFFMLIGGQSPAQLKKGQDILKDVAIGLIIVYGAWLFIGFFLQAFGVADWKGIGMDLTKWWQIPCSQ